MNTPSRRSIMFASVAGAFAAVTGKLFAAPAARTIRGMEPMILKNAARDAYEKFKRELEAENPPVPAGPGKTRFHATFCPLPSGKRLYFNGVDWTGRGIECETAHGWVLAYDAKPDGNGGWNLEIPRDNYEKGTAAYKHYGKVEIR